MVTKCPKQGSCIGKRHADERERLQEHTKKLPALTVGDSVYIQNETSKSPLRRDESEPVVEVKYFYKYKVRVIQVINVKKQ